MTEEERKRQIHRLDLGLRPECELCGHDQWVYRLRPFGWTCQRHPEWFLDEMKLYSPTIEHSPNEDQTWREHYGRGYREAEARGLEPWQAREEASRAAWSDYEARTGRKRFERNGVTHIDDWFWGWETVPGRIMGMGSLHAFATKESLDDWVAESHANMMYGHGGPRREISASAAGNKSVSYVRIHDAAGERSLPLYQFDKGWRPKAHVPNPAYYVWVLARGSDEPLADEGPFGPYDTLQNAKTYARIGATEGAHDRAVSLGIDPKSPSFQIVRRYQARTGERLL